MGAARFAAAIAARERADPEYRQRAAARRELGREIWKLETKYRGQIEDLRRELAAAQTALREAKASNENLQHHLQTTDAAFRRELTTVRAALNDAQAENEGLRRHLGRLQYYQPLNRGRDARANNDHPLKDRAGQDEAGWMGLSRPGGRLALLTRARSRRRDQLVALHASAVASSTGK
jgi:chromosome segregation ATPase